MMMLVYQIGSTQHYLVEMKIIIKISFINVGWGFMIHENVGQYIYL